LEIVEKFTQTNALDVIVVDSVAGLVPKEELESGDAKIGSQARMMSHALRKLAGVVSKVKTCIIFTNQIREKIGIMFGNPETTPGGRALKFYASVRIEIRKVSVIRHGDNAIGNIVRATVQKNKVAPPFRKAEFEIIYGRGIRRMGDVLFMAEQNGILEKAGFWYSYKDQKIGNGRDASISFLEEHKDVAKEVIEALKKKIKSGVTIQQKDTSKTTEE
jgi:recombination protein RecA